MQKDTALAVDSRLLIGMKKGFDMDIKFWLELLLRIVVGVIAIVLAIFIAYLIWNSELPLWLKWFLLN